MISIDKKKPYILKVLINAGYSENYFNYIFKADPIAVKSGGKKTPFVNLILKWLINYLIVLPEDIETVSKVLSKANDLVNNKGVKLNINNYNSPGDLRKDVNDKLGVVEKETYDYLELVDQIPGFKLYEVSSWEEGERAFKDSGWCVQRKNHFDEYKPPYFMVVTSDDKRYALMHKDSNQIKDVHDNSLTIDKANPIKKFILELWPRFVFSDDLLYITDLWPGAINKIKRSKKWSYNYTRDIIEGRWPEVEKIIKQDPKWAYNYAHNIINGRWSEGEKAIKQSPRWAYKYALNVIKGRWSKGEKVIKQSPEFVYWYAHDVIKGRWLEAEKTIKQNSKWTYEYIVNISNCKWPEGEEIIKKNKKWWNIYKIHLGPYYKDINLSKSV